MTTQATEASIVGGKRKKSVSGVAIEDDLPDHLHYHGNHLDVSLFWSTLALRQE